MQPNPSLPYEAQCIQTGTQADETSATIQSFYRERLIKPTRLHITSCNLDDLDLVAFIGSIALTDLVDFLSSRLSRHVFSA